VDKPVFAPEFYRELASDNPFGLTLHWREVEAWFNYIAWPAYKTYNYKRHHQTVRRWWARCRSEDLERARDAMSNKEMENAQKQQDDLPASGDYDGAPYDDTIRSIFGGKGGRT
jgi:hypothetical protein